MTHSTQAGIAVPGALLAGIVAAAGALVSGCGSPTTPTIPAEGNSSPGSRCEERLNTALDMMQPDRLGVSADRQTAAAVLNEWLSECAGTSLPETSLDSRVRALLVPVLSAAEMRRLTSRQFTARDADHVRNCRLYRAIARQVTDRAGSGLEGVVALFHFVVRNVALLGPQDEPLPMAPFEILVTGRGTAEDQAWVFANLLRQVHVEAVILRPQAADNEDRSPRQEWLVGVLLDGQVYLFDPKLGSAVPAPDDAGESVLVERPATLAQVLADDTVLRQLRPANSQRFLLGEGDSQKLRVAVVGNTGYWSLPMQVLQESLAGDRSAIVFDPLLEQAGRPGVVSRVAEYGSQWWQASNVEVWEHPVRRLRDFERTKSTEEFKSLWALFSAPLRKKLQVSLQGAQRRETKQYVFDPNTGEIVFEGPTHAQLNARVRQLEGEPATAAAEFQKTRLNDVSERELPVNPAIRAFHAAAARDAGFFVGLCQMERGDWQSAAATFGDYLNSSGAQPTGLRVRHARSMLALCLAESGDPVGAIRTLKEAESEGPLGPRHRFWIRRWRREGIDER